MNDLERFAQATGLKVNIDPNCPPDRFYLVNKKMLDDLAQELSKETTE